jgi:hypothetical protein
MSVALLGEDFGGGWLRKLFAPVNPDGIWRALFGAAILLGLYFLLQFACSLGATLVLFDGAFEAERVAVKASLVAVFPAALMAAAAAWTAAKRSGSDPVRVLNLRWPRLTLAGWGVLLVSFMLAMYLAILILAFGLGLDLDQYTPGPDGQSPETGSVGLVKEAMYDIANEPWLFALVFPSIALGAPIAEELIFRGQLFSALSLTRLGVSGTVVVTSAAWASLHFTEPWLSVGLIFFMGLLFGYIMYRFGSLWLTMACHALWNAAYGLIVFTAIGGQP